jgi:hypothetical protein
MDRLRTCRECKSKGQGWSVFLRCAHMCGDVWWVQERLQSPHCSLLGIPGALAFYQVAFHTAWLFKKLSHQLTCLKVFWGLPLVGFHLEQPFFTTWRGRKRQGPRRSDPGLPIPSWYGHSLTRSW